MARRPHEAAPELHMPWRPALAGTALPGRRGARPTMGARLPTLGARLPTSPPRYCRASRLQSGLSPPAGAAGWTSSSSTSSCWTCALRETTPWGAPSKPYGSPRQTSPWVATVATAMAAATVGRRRLASHTGAQPTNRCWAAASQQASPQIFPWGAGGAGGVCRRGQESPRQTNP